MTLILFRPLCSLDPTSLSKTMKAFAYVSFGPYLLFLNFLDFSAYLFIGPYLLCILPDLPWSPSSHLSSFDFYPSTRVPWTLPLLKGLCPRLFGFKSSPDVISSARLFGSFSAFGSLLREPMLWIPYVCLSCFDILIITANYEFVNLFF